MLWEGPWLILDQQLWSGRDAGQSEEEHLSASQDKGLRAWRVGGRGAGNSLDSRGDPWELRQTHERAQILGKSQLLPLFPEILRKIQQPSFQCGELVSICEVGWEGGSWPGRQASWFGSDSWPWPSHCPLSASVSLSLKR